MADHEHGQDDELRLVGLLLKGASRHMVDLTADEIAELQEMVERKGLSRRSSAPSRLVTSYKEAVMHSLRASGDSSS